MVVALRKCGSLAYALPFCSRFCCGNGKRNLVFRNNVEIRKRHFAATKLRNAYLSPQEVTSILRDHEHTEEATIPGIVKSFDSNQLASNNPLEDSRAEARCIYTTGMLFGVFDGHGGSACANVVSERLLQYIAASLLPVDYLRDYIKALDSGAPFDLLHLYNDKFEIVEDLQVVYNKSFRAFLSLLLADHVNLGNEFLMRDALTHAFVQLDEDLSREALPDETNDKTLAVAVSGAVACVVHVDGVHLHVANLGDCQGVLGMVTETNTWQAKCLTREHNSDNLAELHRILNDHPNNERDTIIKQDRLLGQLAPLRAFGDFRYKWKKEQLQRILVPRFGNSSIPPNYYTPPYLTAFPEVTYHRLSPRDKFMVIASDGLWDQMTPSQIVRLVGEHMSGKVTLSPLRLPKISLHLKDINLMLQQRKEGLSKKPLDSNAATHLIRHALGGTEYGIDHGKLSQLLSMPEDTVRNFRDDITITVVFFDTEYLRHCPV